jgi:predicted anti-sigma-YlaC factor YlaD
MPPLVTLPAGIMAAGAPASAVVTTNTRVKTQMGALGIATDVLSFPGPMVTGAWTVTNTRVKVGQIPTVSTASVGVATSPLPASAPVSVTMGDTKVSGS